MARAPCGKAPDGGAASAAPIACGDVAGASGPLRDGFVDALAKKAERLRRERLERAEAEADATRHINTDRREDEKQERIARFLQTAKKLGEELGDHDTREKLRGATPEAIVVYHWKVKERLEWYNEEGAARLSGLPP